MNKMDKLQEEMQKQYFAWAYDNEISFKGKDRDGYYSLCVGGLENDDYDIACYLFTDYEKLKKFIASTFGEGYYDFLYEKFRKTLDSVL